MTTKQQIDKSTVELIVGMKTCCIPVGSTLHSAPGSEIQVALEQYIYLDLMYKIGAEYDLYEIARAILFGERETKRLLRLGTI